MQDLSIALVQTSLAWEDVTGNLAMLDGMLETVGEDTDLILLPEMFPTGFSMNADKCAEPPDGPAWEWLRRKAAEKGCVIAGSILTVDDGKYYNRFAWMRPDGTRVHYDKRHLFSMGGEHHTMTAGKSNVIVDLHGWKVCLQVCYDLRFPVWSRNTFENGQHAYDVLVYVANWPEVRRPAYQALLPARAIENQAYLLWVNRVGKDGRGIGHSGDSGAYDPLGNAIAMAGTGTEEVLHVVLSADLLLEQRSKFQVGPDWDRFWIDE